MTFGKRVVALNVSLTSVRLSTLAPFAGSLLLSASWARAGEAKAVPRTKVARSARATATGEVFIAPTRLPTPPRGLDLPAPDLQPDAGQCPFVGVDAAGRLVDALQNLRGGQPRVGGVAGGRRLLQAPRPHKQLV